MSYFSEEQTKNFISRLDKRANGVNVLIEDSDGRLLVLKPTYDDSWGLPGGWVETSETIQEAGIRELNEELKLAVSADQLIFERLIDMKHPYGHIQVTVFRLSGVLSSKHQLLFQESEIEKYDWVSRDDILGPRDNRSYTLAVQLWADRSEKKYCEV